jgi:predicted phage terminase large subunit-like protein
MNQYKIENLKENELKSLRKELCKNNISNFIKMYLSHHYTFDEKKLIKLERMLLEKGHNIKIDKKLSEDVVFNKASLSLFKIFDKIISGYNLLVAIVFPRGFAKTTNLLSFILFCLAYEIEDYIVFVGESESKCVEMMTAIQGELEFNQLLLIDFPHLKPAINKMTRKAKSYTKTSIVLENGAKCVSVSAQSNIRGLKYMNKRPGIVLVDDLENDTNVDSYNQRRKLEKWLKRVVLPLGGGTGCSVVIAGTVLHHDGLMASLTKEDRDDSYEDYVPVVLSAEDENGNSTWPEVYPNERLAIEKMRLGPAGYANEFLGKPIAEEDQVFTIDDINTHLFSIDTIKDQKDISSVECPVIAGVDCAEVGRGDFSVIIIGTKIDGVNYILDAFIKKIHINKLATHIISKIKEWNIGTIGIESNNMEHFIQTLKDAIYEEKLSCNVIGIKHGGNTKKEHRIISYIIPPLKSNLLLFRSDYKQAYPNLIDQMLSFPVGSHDDAIDALAIYFETIKKYLIPFYTFEMK